MVSGKELKNKEGEVLKTKEGVTLIDYRLEAGDEFIPQFNSIISRSSKREFEENGKKVTKTITNHSLNIIVKGFNNNESFFVTLTPTQAKSIQKKIDDKVLINQELFNAYEYEDNDGNLWVGVGIKKEFIKPKTFEDFEKEKLEEE